MLGGGGGGGGGGDGGGGSGGGGGGGERGGAKWPGYYCPEQMKIVNDHPNPSPS
jgi:hypothetical protein